MDNAGHEVSLLLGKVYRVVKPDPNDFPDWLRVIDEDGEEYLYPARRFVPVELPRKARRAIAAAVSA